MTNGNMIDWIQEKLGLRPRAPQVVYVPVYQPPAPARPEPPMVQLSPGGRDAARGPLTFREHESLGGIVIGERSPGATVRKGDRGTNFVSGK